MRFELNCQKKKKNKKPVQKTRKPSARLSIILYCFDVIKTFFRQILSYQSS